VAFAGVDRNVWRVFTEPATLPQDLAVSGEP